MINTFGIVLNADPWPSSRNLKAELKSETSKKQKQKKTVKN